MALERVVDPVLCVACLFLTFGAVASAQTLAPAPAPAAEAESSEVDPFASPGDQNERPQSSADNGQPAASNPASPNAVGNAPSALGGGNSAVTSPPQQQQGQPSAARNPAPPASPFKPLFFENDFTPYVGKPPYVLGEELKNLPIDLPGDDLDFNLSVGGQIRHRYHDERNRIRPGGPGHDTYQLWRWRQYYDLKNDYVRFYVETIDASQFGEELPPTPIDVNRFDLQNAFVDLNLYDGDFGKTTFRYGRQELLYGKQRLLSPLDWSNTRRNFEGFKLFHVGEGWRFDAFAVNPVNSSARAGFGFQQYDTSPDRADHQRTLYGGYLSMTDNPAMSMDLYTLYQDDERARVNFAEGDRGLSGGRVYGLIPSESGKTPDRVWDYDVEGGYQWGSDLGQRVSAGFATTELGHTWKKVAWSPRIAGLFYYGSGNGTATGNGGTFYTYYPLGHAYWGIIDNLSGQNLLDYSLQGSVNPTKKLNIAGAYHYFEKANGNDFLYNVAQAPNGQRGGSRDLGNEVDVVGTYNFNANLNLQVGYAHFWYGNFVRQALPRDDADFYYVMTTFNY